MDDLALASVLDVTVGNAYYAVQDGLLLPEERERTQTWMTDGTWALYLSADRMYSSRQEPFMVFETNASSIGMHWDNRPAYDGQWRQAAWALVSRGASMIEYWHWNSLPFGTETYWGGVLPHTGQPGRAYRQIAELGADFAAAGDLVAGLTPDADIAMVFSLPSRWVMQKFPPCRMRTGHRTAARTKDSSSRSTGARSTPICKSGSCMRDSSSLMTETWDSRPSSYSNSVVSSSPAEPTSQEMQPWTGCTGMRRLAAISSLAPAPGTPISKHASVLSASRVVSATPQAPGTTSSAISPGMSTCEPPRAHLSP